MSVPISDHLRRLIDAKAAFASLPEFVSDHYRCSFSPGTWLEGLVLTESSGNARARRYEPHQDRATRRNAREDPDPPDQDSGDIEDDASFGLCQVMGYNIRKIVGVRMVDGRYPPMSFAWAFDADVNLWLGCTVLRWELAAVGGDVERALARYNGGPTGDDVLPEYGNDMRLRRYVDKVVKNSFLVDADRHARGWSR